MVYKAILLIAISAVFTGCEVSLYVTIDADLVHAFYTEQCEGNTKCADEMTNEFMEFAGNYNEED